MSSLIKIKRSAVQGKSPNTSIMELGELALNTYDGKLFFKKDNGTEAIVTIQEVTEDNLAIDSSTLGNSTATYLSEVLSDFDTVLTAATGGELSVFTDSTINGNGTAGTPLSVANGGHTHTSSNITDFSTAVGSIITSNVNKTFVDGLNVNADTLDGQQGTYYLDYVNFTNKPTIGDATVTFTGDSVIIPTGSFSVNDTVNSSIDLAVNTAAISITESQISDLQSYLTSETVTSLSLSENTLVYVNENGVDTNIDLSIYLDYSDTKVRNAISVSGDLSYDLNTGVISYSTPTIGDATIDFTGDSVILVGATTSFSVNDVANSTIALSVNTAAISITESQISDLGTYVHANTVGQASGVASLDVTGKVPASQLPSYVDDVLEYADFASFPVTGEAGKIYVDIAASDVYRWTGSAYIIISDAVSSADQATKLATARTIALTGDVTGSATFDGTANATITAVVGNDSHNHTVSTITDFGTSVNTAIDNRVTNAFVDALNVDAATLEGSNGAFYLDYTNFTNTPTIPQSGVDFDPVGTDNSTNVTLAGTYDYLTITGQAITLNQIDYTTDISNLPTLYTTADANTDIDARVTKAFVDALNVDADTLDGNDSSYFTNASNIATGTLASARLPDLTVADFAAASIQTSAEAFSDSDTVLMTAKAVADKIESYGFINAETDNQTLIWTSANTTLAISGGNQVNLSSLLDDTNTTYDLVLPGSGVLRLSDSANANDDVTFIGSGATSVSSNATHIVISSTDTNTTYSNGAGIGLSGTTFSHLDTSTVTDLTPSLRTYVTGLTFDDFGHVTGVSTGTELVVNTDNYVDGVSFSTANGDLTLTRTGALADLVINLDGRYLTSETDTTYDLVSPGSGVLRLSDSANANDDITFIGTGAASVSSNSTHIIVNATDTDTTYSNGAGIGLSGTTFSHLDTSSQSSSINSGRTYIQTITLDAYGHVTGINEATETVTDTTYDLVSPGSGVLRLSDSSNANDDVTFVGSGATTVSSNATHISISSTDSDTTYSAGNNMVLSGTEFSVNANPTFTTTKLTPQDPHPSHSEGQIFYSGEYKALTYHNDISDVSLQVGLEEWIRVYNGTASTITNGTPVYATGATGETITIAPADSLTEEKAQVIGIATHDIAASTEGVVTVRGLVAGLNTSNLTSGGKVHMSPSGGLQSSAPTYPYFPVDLGWCVVSDVSNGYIYVSIENHTFEQFRVTGNQHIDGDLQIDGDLVVTGTQSVVSQASLAIDDSFVYLNSGDTIGLENTTFSGTGLNDAYFNNHYEGTTTKTFYVRIDGVGTGTGGVDTFEWSLDNFSTTEATGVDLATEVLLSDNICIHFNALTGHTLNDTWSGTAAPLNVDSGWFSNRNTGASGVGYTHMGIFFDVSDNKFKVVEEYDPEPEGTINTSDASFNLGTIVADTFEGTATNASNLNGQLPSYYLNFNNFTNVPTYDNFQRVGFGIAEPAGAFGQPIISSIAYNVNSLEAIYISQTSSPVITANVVSGAAYGVSGALVDLGLDLNSLTTSTSNADGDYFVVVDTAGAQKKLTKGNINISGFNNDAGYITGYTESDTLNSVTGRGATTTNEITVGGLSFDSSVKLDANGLTTVSTTQVTLTEFSINTYSGGKFVINARDTSGNAHMTELMVVHDFATASATEYGTINTGTSLFSVDVDISGPNFRIRITPTSATSTTFNVSETLFYI